MAIWNSCNTDIPQSLNSRDSFLRRKFENWALTSCRLGAVLSWSTISFECQNGGGDRPRKVQYFWQFSEVQKPHDLDFGSGQGHISMHNTCRTTSMPNHLTVASRTAEIWPFEFREISTVRELWTLVIGFLEGNSKIGLWQAVDQVPYYYLQTTNHQFWAPRENGGGDRPRKLHKLHDLDLDRVELTLVRISGWGLPTHQITSKVEKLFVDVQTDGRTWVPIYYVITWRWPNKIVTHMKKIWSSFHRVQLHSHQKCKPVVTFCVHMTTHSSWRMWQLRNFVPLVLSGLAIGWVSVLQKPALQFCSRKTRLEN